MKKKLAAVLGVLALAGTFVMFQNFSSTTSLTPLTDQQADQIWSSVSSYNLSAPTSVTYVRNVTGGFSKVTTQRYSVSLNNGSTGAFSVSCTASCSGNNCGDTAGCNPDGAHCTQTYCGGGCTTSCSKTSSGKFLQVVDYLIN